MREHLENDHLNFFLRSMFGFDNFCLQKMILKMYWLNDQINIHLLTDDVSPILRLIFFKFFINVHSILFLRDQF